MPKLLPLDGLVERGIRNSLSDLKALPPAERSAALKIAIDFLKYQRVVQAESELGSEFRKPFDAEEDNQ